MAYFAKLDSNNKVLEVQSLNNNVILDNGVEVEEKGVEFLSNLFNWPNWKKTSFNTIFGVYYNTDPITGIRTVSSDQSKAFRGNYAGIGSIYDINNDVFYSEQPYPSWTISGPSWKWEAPVPIPNDGNYYNWDENTQSWILFNP